MNVLAFFWRDRYVVRWQTPICNFATPIQYTIRGRVMRSALLFLFTAVIASSAGAAPPPPVRLTFASLDVDAVGMPVMIPALYFRPATAAPDARIPLVIAVHGCGGMFGSAPNRQTEVSARYADWTARFLDDGFAVLLPDSFTPRGRREICTIRTTERTIDVAMRRLDVLGALAHTTAMQGVDVARIALVGWSNGGTTTLAAINVQDSRVAAARRRPDAPYFRAAVAFYPACAPSLRAGARWQTVVPAAIHIGDIDDWTPSTACVDLAAAMRARGDPVTVTVYPGSHHGFDAPRGRIVVRHEVPNGVRPGQGVTVGPNPAARAAANESVRAFLRKWLQHAAETPATGTPNPR